MRNIKQISKQTKQINTHKFNADDAFAEGVNFFHQTEDVKPTVQNAGKNYLCSQAEFWKEQLYKNSTR